MLLWARVGSILHSLWCVYMWEEKGLKGPVSVPSLRVQVLFHARLQRVSLFHGGRS